jgi:prophage antirepressor-like protein
VADKHSAIPNYQKEKVKGKPMIREFEHNAYGKVRATIVDDEPCFNLKDLCRMFEIKSVSEVRTKLNDTSIKLVSVLHDKTHQNMFFVTADHLSTIFFQSKRKDAEVIGDWLYRTVLPQLIRYGIYQIEDFENPDKVIEFLDEFQELKVRANVLETTLKMNTPKIKSIDNLLGTTSCVDLDMVHEVIRFKNIGRDVLLKILRTSNVLDDQNIPFQDFCDKKHFRVVEAKVVSGGTVIKSTKTYVYKSGISFIERILKEYDGNKQRKEK